MAYLAHPTPLELSRVFELYNQGLYLQAYKLAQTYSPIQTWSGTAARLIAGRLVMQLGAPRLGYALNLWAWRVDPSDPEALYYYTRVILARRGVLAAWEILRQHQDLPDATPQQQADWLTLRAHVLGRLRDFDSAESCLSWAEKLAPDHPWLWIERSTLYEFQDRYPESLAAAQHSLSLHPWYRPGVESTAHVLELLDRDAEALELLQQASQVLESGSVVAQLARLQTELGHHAEARQSYERIAELSPLLDQGGILWLAARRSDTAYYCADFAASAEWAKQAGGPFYRQLAERLENLNGKVLGVGIQKNTDSSQVTTKDITPPASPSPPSPPAPPSPPSPHRILLPVGFVRQHHMTCGPATLSTISRFWSMPVDLQRIADEICYNGTSAYSERHWAEQNGWRVREFTLSWDSAVALIDRGIPFTLATVEPTSAHLQAVIGYDSCRETLIIRDPYVRHSLEFWAQTMQLRYRATGPHCMALVPQAQASLFDDLDLPDAALYDQLYQLEQALQVYDREAAARVYEEMATVAPGHRLTLQARRNLAIYDADPSSLLSCIEQLLELFPNDGKLLLGKLSGLYTLARREDRVTLLESICQNRYSDPVFWQQYAQLLADDAREHPKAIELLRRAIQVFPSDAPNYYILANILWEQRQFQIAFELYRFATCLDDKNQKFAQAYFTAARYFRRKKEEGIEEALEFLQRRFERFGKQSSQPAQTLFWAYNQLSRLSEALAVLDAAQKLRPEDGELLLFSADSHAYYGKYDRAEALLHQAKGKVGEISWLRTAANLAQSRGELTTALKLWQQVLDVQPLAMDTNRAVARLLAETQSRTAALEFLQQAASRFPHHYGLHQLWCHWLHDDDPATAEAVLRRLIEIDPVDAWAHRELAWQLYRQRRLEEAFAEADIAYRLDPCDPSYFCVKGSLCTVAGQLREAKAAYQEAIRLSVDTDFAISELIALCTLPAEKREALDFIYEELVRQVIFGDGLLAFRQQAQNILEAEELLARLRQALTARPDLWHAWSAVIRQLAQMNQLEEALDLAKQGTERFPLLPRMWLELAKVYQLRKEREAEIAALEQTLQLNPNWAVAMRQLAEVYEQAGELEKARSVLEEAVLRTPLDAYNHGCLADILWRLGEKEAAFAQLEKAVQLEPSYSWGWDALRDWAKELQRSEVAVQRVRELTVSRGGEARSWLLLAQTLSEPEDLPERLAALDQAISLNPHCIDAYDLKAKLLGQAGRFDEALAACRPEVWEELPTSLRSRAAWVESRRGNLDVSIGMMQVVVEIEPNFYGGWQYLADLYYAVQDYDHYLETAERMVQLAPLEALGWGYRGEAKGRMNDRAGAKADFRRAFELQPDYGFAGFCLFDAQLADKELDAAAQTLAILRVHVGGEYVLAREIQLSAEQNNLNRAMECLRDLSVSQTQEGWPFETSMNAIRSAEWIKEAQQVLEESLSLPNCNPLVSLLWVQCCVAQAEWQTCEQQLQQLRTQEKLLPRAVGVYLQSLAIAEQYERLHRYIEQNRDWFRRDTYLWGCVGYALSLSGEYHTLLQWLADWEDRTELQPWMLSNLVDALRRLHHDSDASYVGRKALKLTADHSTPYHQLWLAVDAALTGDAQSTAELLTGLNLSSLDESEQFLYELVQAMLIAQSAELVSRQRRFNLARKQLRQAVTADSAFRKDALLRRTYRQSVWRIAANCGGIIPFVWAVYQLVKDRFLQFILS